MSMMKQVATLLGKVGENLPEMSPSYMQWLIDNGGDLQKMLVAVAPTIMWLLKVESKCFGSIKAHVLHPAWDFLILQSDKYPEIAIAASNRNGILGVGFKIKLLGEKYDATFVGPCLCCQDWIRQLFPFIEIAVEGDYNSLDIKEREEYEKKARERDHAASRLAGRLVRDKCKELGIKFLFLHCPYDSHSPFVLGENLVLLDPQLGKKAWDQIDGQRFAEAFRGILPPSTKTKGGKEIESWNYWMNRE